MGMDTDRHRWVRLAGREDELATNSTKVPKVKTLLLPEGEGRDEGLKFRLSGTLGAAGKRFYFGSARKNTDGSAWREKRGLSSRENHQAFDLA